MLVGKSFLSEASRASFITRQDACNIVRSLDNHVRTAIVNTLMTDDGTKIISDVRFVMKCSYVNFYVDSALPVAFRNIFTNTTHLPCRWHIDRYVITAFIHLNNWLDM